MCANAIERFFIDRNLALKISENAYNDKCSKDNENIALFQLKVYKEIADIVS